jgi:hypothetical protein
MYEVNEMWTILVEYGIATDEEIGLVVALNGKSVRTLNDILYVRTGCRNLEQFFEEDEDE